jgi:hypothetical protein
LKNSGTDYGFGFQAVSAYSLNPIAHAAFHGVAAVHDITAPEFLHGKHNFRHRITQLAIFRNQRGTQVLRQRDVLRIIASGRISGPAPSKGVPRRLVDFAQGNAD